MKDILVEVQPSTSQQITRTLCEDSKAVLWLSPWHSGCDHVTMALVLQS